MTSWTRLLTTYLAWHWSTAIRRWWQIYLDFLWFCFHFFSLGLLVRTLFSPWRRLAENYPKEFVPSALAETLVVNGLMRLVGASIRLILIAFGLVCLTVVFVLGWVAFVLWLLTPFLPVVLWVVGLYLVL